MCCSFVFALDVLIASVYLLQNGELKKQLEVAMENTRHSNDQLQRMSQHWQRMIEGSSTVQSLFFHGSIVLCSE